MFDFKELGPSRIVNPIQVISRWEQGSELIRKKPVYDIDVFLVKKELLQDFEKLYKQHGFNRKRTVTCDELKEQLTKEIPTKHLLSFLSKSLNINIVFVDDSSIEFVNTFPDNPSVTVVTLNKRFTIEKVVDRNNLKDFVSHMRPCLPLRQLKKLA